MIQDLHSHTYFSFCGQDAPQAVIDAAIHGGVELLGISDHSYGVALQRDSLYQPHRPDFLTDYQRCINAYRDMLFLLKERYAGKIELKCGIELPTAPVPSILLPKEVDISGFEYCLVEHLDHPDTTEKDLFAFARRCGCDRVGVAHTDLPAFLERRGIDPLDYFSEMAKQGIFWELNVNCDSVHGFREHAYVERFFADERLQDTVRRSRVQLSVGFDGHRVAEYKAERVQACCRRLMQLEIPLVFAERG